MKNGGSAFPVSTGFEYFQNGAIAKELSSTAGLTIRDYFAGQALAGIPRTTVFLNEGHEILDAAEMAKACFAVADAMIAEREKPPVC